MRSPSRSNPVVRCAAATLFVGALALAGCSKDADTTTGPGSSGSVGSSTSAGGTTNGTGKSHTQASAAELEEYQKDLNAVGCWTGPVDGKLGKETEAAIMAFQKAAKLTVDGLLGPITEAALDKAAMAGTVICTGGGGTTTTHSGGGSTSTTKPAGSTTTTHSAGSSTTATAAGSSTTSSSQPKQ